MAAVTPLQEIELHNVDLTNHQHREDGDDRHTNTSRAASKTLSIVTDQEPAEMIEMSDMNTELRRYHGGSTHGENVVMSMSKTDEHTDESNDEEEEEEGEEDHDPHTRASKRRTALDSSFRNAFPILGIHTIGGQRYGRRSLFMFPWPSPSSSPGFSPRSSLSHSKHKQKQQQQQQQHNQIQPTDSPSEVKSWTHSISQGLQRLREYSYRWKDYPTSYFLSPKEQQLIKQCHSFIEGPLEIFVVIVIIMNSIMLAADPEPSYHTSLWYFYYAMDYIFAIVYAFEAAFKIVVYGFLFNGPESYLRSGWNVVDFVVAITACVQLGSLGVPLTAFRLFRLLKFAQKYYNLLNETGAPLGRLLNALFSVIPQLVDVLLFVIFILILMSVAGMQFFGGVFQNRCFQETTGIFDPTMLCSTFSNLGNQCPDGYFCATTNTNPNNGVTNFDNIGTSFITVLQCASLQGWSEIMYMVDATLSRYYEIFFILIILLSAFFVINLIYTLIAVRFIMSIEEEAQRGEQSIGNDDVEEESSGHVDRRQPQPHVIDTTPWPPARLIIYNPLYTTLKSIVVILNCILLGSNSLNISDYHAMVIYKCEIALTIYFGIDVLLHYLGLGFIVWIKDFYNWIDMSLVVLSIAELALPDSAPSHNIFSAVAAFRFLRIFQTLQNWSALQEVMKSVTESLSEMIPFFLVLIVYIYVFTIAGMAFYRHSVPSTVIHPRAKFDNFLWGALSIFQLLVGDDWQQLLFVGKEYAGWSAVPFYIIAWAIGNLLSLGMITAVIVRNFFHQTEEEEEKLFYKSKEQDYRERVMNPTVLKFMQFMKQVGYWIQNREWLDVKEIDKREQEKERIEELEHQARELGMDPSDLLQQREGTSKAHDAAVARLKDRTTRTTIQTEMPTHEAIDVIVKKAIASSTLHHAPTATLLGNARNQNQPESSSVDAAHLPLERSDSASSVHYEMDSRKAAAFADSNVMIEGGVRVTDYRPQEGRIDHTDIHGKSFFYFKKNHHLRLKVSELIHSDEWERFSWSFVLFSIVMLAFYNPNENPSDFMADVLYKAEFCIMFGYVVEAMLKVFALGFIGHRGCYLSNGWNWLELLVAVLGVANQVIVRLDGVSDSTISIYRAFLACRCFRLVTLYGPLRLMTSAILWVIPDVVNVFMVAGLFFSVFAILGMELFKGKMNACWDHHLVPSQIVPGYDMPKCLSAGLTWRNPPGANFDDFSGSLATLFEMSTRELWYKVMYFAMDGVGYGLAPITDHNPGAALFFVAFELFGAFYAVSLFTGQIVLKFSRLYETYTGEHVLPVHRCWLRMKQQFLNLPPPNAKAEEVHPLRQKLRDILIGDGKQYTSFELVMMFLIFINLILMAIEYYNEPDPYHNVMEVINGVFTWIFMSEVVVKMFALGVIPYFKDEMNRFDFVVVSLSYIAWWFSVTGFGVSFHINPSFLRCFRVLRMLRAIRSFPGLRTLVETVALALPGLTLLGIILGMVLYAYSVAGMQLWGGLQFAQYINRWANFTNFSFAFVTLFRVATGDHWNGIMHDSQVEPPFCGNPVTGDTSNCGSYFGGYGYFTSFVVIATFILGNVFVALLLHQLKRTLHDISSPVTAYHFDLMRECWAAIVDDDFAADPSRHPDRLLLSADKLPQYLRLLPHPLGPYRSMILETEKSRKDRHAEKKLSVVSPTVTVVDQMKKLLRVDTSQTLSTDPKLQTVDPREMAPLPESSVPVTLTAVQKLQARLSDAANAERMVSESDPQLHDPKRLLRHRDLGLWYYNQLQLPIIMKNKVHYHDVVEAIMARVIRLDPTHKKFRWEDIPIDNALSTRLQQLERRLYPDLRPNRFKNLFSHREACSIIAKTWRSFVKRKTYKVTDPGREKAKKLFEQLHPQDDDVFEDYDDDETGDTAVENKRPTLSRPPSLARKGSNTTPPKRVAGGPVLSGPDRIAKELRLRPQDIAAFSASQSVPATPTLNASTPAITATPTVTAQPPMNALNEDKNETEEGEEKSKEGNTDDSKEAPQEETLTGDDSEFSQATGATSDGHEGAGGGGVDVEGDARSRRESCGFGSAFSIFVETPDNTTSTATTSTATPAPASSSIEQLHRVPDLDDEDKEMSQAENKDKKKKKMKKKTMKNDEENSSKKDSESEVEVSKSALSRNQSGDEDDGEEQEISKNKSSSKKKQQKKKKTKKPKPTHDSDSEEELSSSAATASNKKQQKKSSKKGSKKKSSKPIISSDSDSESQEEQKPKKKKKTSKPRFRD